MFVAYDLKKDQTHLIQLTQTQNHISRDDFYNMLSALLCCARDDLWAEKKKIFDWFSHVRILSLNALMPQTFMSPYSKALACIQSCMNETEKVEWIQYFFYRGNFMSIFHSISSHTYITYTGNTGCFIHRRWFCRLMLNEFILKL